MKGGGEGGGANGSGGVGGRSAGTEGGAVNRLDASRISGKEWSDLSSQDKQDLAAVTAFTSNYYGWLRESGEAFPGERKMDIKVDGNSIQKVQVKESQASEMRSRLKDLAAQPYAGTLHRGMSLPNEAVGKITQGQVFDLGHFASASTDRGVARAYAGNGGHGRPVVFSIKASKGTPIHRMSQLRSEEEVLTGGKIRIRSVSDRGGVLYVDAEHI